VSIKTQSIGLYRVVSVSVCPDASFQIVTLGVGQGVG
jgi:hypothetical protein